jgi:PAS domain S-box-containing protein
LLRIRQYRTLDNRLEGVVVTFIDITEVKRAQEVGDQLASIVESSNEAIVSKGLNGIIASWNKGAQHLFGYAAEEVIGKSISILIPADRESEEPGILDRIRRGVRVESYETVRRRKDGTMVDIGADGVTHQKRREQNHGRAQNRP